jgi:hypothetical protein
MREAMPGSLTDVRTISRWTLGVTGALSVVELIAMDGRFNVVWLSLAIVVPPIAGCVYAADALAQRRSWSAFRRLSLALGVHAALFFGLAFYLARGDTWSESFGIALVGVAVVFGAIVTGCAPILIAATALGPRKSLEAGDVMLGVCGVWFAIVQTIALALVDLARSSDVVVHGPVMLLMLGFMVVGVGAFGVSLARGIARRSWCSRLLRGELEGWRIRRDTSEHELAKLPVMFGSPCSGTAVVERVEVGGVMYRSGLVAEPVAVIRAHALNEA